MGIFDIFKRKPISAQSELKKKAIVIMIARMVVKISMMDMMGVIQGENSAVNDLRSIARDVIYVGNQSDSFISKTFDLVCGAAEEIDPFIPGLSMSKARTITDEELSKIEQSIFK